jgi:1-deoxy-D-xylulose-5-phosphate reductoisomerase
MMQKIALLGSTGSIGTQALDVISKYPSYFKVEVLTGGNNIDLLTAQARAFKPHTVVISNKNLFRQLRDNLAGTNIKVLAGEEALEEAAGSPGSDIVLASIVGYSGLIPTISALNAGKIVALANKETLVVAGEIISRIVAGSGAKIIPVDSEHSAIFQCLAGEDTESVEMITLTASGGPFFNMSIAELERVGPAEALRHPNWNMGAKVTIDSASMMNKGLEVIEAKWLFNLDPAQVKVIIHPQSVIHSFVHFRDGSVKAQLGIPDMRTPILYALGYPGRLQSDLPRLVLNDRSCFTFSEPDTVKFRNLLLAYKAINQGGNMPCVLNAANEMAVNAFLEKRIGFMQISRVVEHALDTTGFMASPDLETLGATDNETRIKAEIFIKKITGNK